VGGPLASKLTYESGVAVESRGVKQVYAYATAGGNDTATLYGSSGGDTFYGGQSAGVSAMVYNGDVQWKSYLQSFDSVTFDGGETDPDTGGAPGGDDVSNLYDSSTSDSFVGGPLASKLTYESGAAVESRRVKRVYVYAMKGGNDTALLYGSSGSDTFSGGQSAGVSTMVYDGDAHWKTYLQGFDSVTADVTVDDTATGWSTGGTDTARLYDSLVDDLFTARGNEASFDYNYNFDDLVEILARGFQTVYASSTKGGTDHKDLDGSETYDLYFLGTYWDN
jgi:hypothetical protein